MKKIRFILLAVSLISFCAISSPAMAQVKSKEEKEKELKMQEEIDAQKKVISEQKKAQDEVQKALQESQKEVDKAMKEAQQKLEATDKYKDMVRVYRGTGDRSRFNVEPIPGDQFMFTPGMEGFNWYSHSGDNQRSTLDFSKSVKESSFSRDYVFDVDLSSTVVMSVNGECNAGEIRIKIVMPNGKVYSDIMIDEFGNLNWRKSFPVTEEENKDKAGAWKFQINASKATGFFRISLQTF
jgi:membrane-associated HD superfamily phosphohydrolase